MDIEKLIAKLRSVSKHPESVLGQAANALAELQTENRKMRAENVQWKQVASEQKKQLDKLQAAMDKLPTITLPDRPLTWNEFAEMEDQPVYIVEMGGMWRYWALVTRVDKDSADFMTVHDSDNYGDRELYGESWVAYRRPPEGEEETR